MNQEIKIYKIGGCVRDDFIGRRSKDIDYAVEANSYEEMLAYIKERGKVHVEHPEHQTIRGRIEGIGDVDFVWCREDGPYTDGRRPDWVKPATLLKDQTRRDFTMNSIAIGEDGTVYDPFGGREHIKFKLITSVGNARDRFKEDALRMMRAIRFHIQLDFVIAPEIEACFDDPEMLKYLSKISLERRREELTKMFEVSVMRSMNLLTQVYPALGYTIFEDKRLWLKPTMRA